LLGKFNLEGISLTPQGVPQIEGTFDIDTDRTMNANAQDKATGKSSKVTITKDKGRQGKTKQEQYLKNNCRSRTIQTTR
jgi:L1 cell adhesion molecule like protein